MRNLLFITLLIALVAAGGSLLLFPQWIQTVALPLVVLSLLLLFLLYRSVIMPAHAVKNGLNLIAAQDFNNRLTPVGELEADNVVKLFNTMIDRLRNERLLNMERENFLQLLVEASPMGILTLDFDNRITLVNPSFRKITGIDTSLYVN
ncbi:MAG: PAS domain-containing protein, partial [Muribaculaceae bacterium]|nr:PAS domain-containing protein [Muribaculaceae bacterium]